MSAAVSAPKTNGVPAAPAAPEAPQLSPHQQNAQAALNLLSRAQIQGGEAMAFLTLAQWLQAIAQGQLLVLPAGAFDARPAAGAAPGKPKPKHS